MYCMYQVSKKMYSENQSYFMDLIETILSYYLITIEGPDMIFFRSIQYYAADLVPKGSLQKKNGNILVFYQKWGNPHPTLVSEGW